MILLQDITLSRGGRDLLRNASAAVVPGSRVALVGRNGCGKSSLFSAIRGEIPLDAGRIDLNGQLIASVDQTAPTSEASVLAYAMLSKPDLAQAWQITQAAQAGRAEPDPDALAAAHQWLSEHDAYRFPSEVAELLDGLGFDAQAQLRTVNSFSGGWKMRLALARALLVGAPVLLLDEPTNHLDLDAIVWLENYLRSYRGTIFLISHDREFVDAAATAVLSFANLQLRLYSGGYTFFEQARSLEREQLQQAQRKHDLQSAHLRSFIDRFRAQATKARQVQSRIKALDRLGQIVSFREPDAPELQFEQVGDGPDPLLTAIGLNAGYQPGQAVVSNASIIIKRQDRIGVLGRNGAGKTTLLRTLVGELAALAGTTVAAQDLRIGYFAQDAVDRLRPDESALLQIGREHPQRTQQEIRNYLATFGIVGERATDPVGPMSGGERARIALARIALTRPHLLILDEPTNHLDSATRDALTSALAQFDGAVLLVSHDRQLLQTCVDRFALIADGKLSAFDGDLADYAKLLASRTARLPLAPQTPNAPLSSQTPRLKVGTGAGSASGPAASAEPSKQQIRQWERRIASIDNEMAKLAAVQSAIETQMQSPEFFRDSALATATQKTYAAQAQLLAELELEWLQLHEQIENPK